MGLSLTSGHNIQCARETREGESAATSGTVQRARIRSPEGGSMQGQRQQLGQNTYLSDDTDTFEIGKDIRRRREPRYDLPLEQQTISM